MKSGDGLSFQEAVIDLEGNRHTVIVSVEGVGRRELLLVGDFDPTFSTDYAWTKGQRRRLTPRLAP